MACPRRELKSTLTTPLVSLRCRQARVSQPSSREEFHGERPAPAGVTEKHLPGPKTEGFRMGRSRFRPDPVPDPVDGSYGSGLINRIKGLEGEKCDWGCDGRCGWGCKLITLALLHSSCGAIV